jgi:hypothetical protein
VVQLRCPDDVIQQATQIMVAIGIFPCKGKFARKKQKSNPGHHYHQATRLVYGAEVILVINNTSLQKNFFPPVKTEIVGFNYFLRAEFKNVFCFTVPRLVNWK